MCIYHSYIYKKGEETNCLEETNLEETLDSEGQILGNFKETSAG